MKIYLDTGNVDEIKKASKTGLIDGVTTNPSLIAKEGRDFKTVIKEISQILTKNSPKDFTLSAEVTAKTSFEMIKQGEELSKIDKHIIVKVPLTKDGLIAVKELSKKKIRCNVTLVFSANQALLAAKSGAWCVSPFLGRIDDQGGNGLDLVKEIRTVFDNYDFQTKILSASIRSEHHVAQAAQLGSDIITMPNKIFEKMYYHPLTNQGIEKFDKDWEEFNKK